MLIESSKMWTSVEYIVIDDGSTDNTSKIAAKFKGIVDLKIIRHESPKGRGFSINEGFNTALGDYLIVFNGKKDTTKEQIQKIYSSLGEADIIVSFQANTHQRPLIRRIFSKSFTTIVNILFSKNLKYYNGSTLIKKEHFNSVSIKTSSYAYDCELLLKLLNLNICYTEVPVNDLYEEGRKTRSFKMKNILGVVYTLIRVFFEVRILRKF